MDINAFNAAKQAYQAGDWASAASQLASVKQPGEVSGEVDHLRGNALMKLGDYVGAAQAYGQALQDASYGHAGALNCNRGRALVASGNTNEAAQCFQAAVADPTYATPYKAYLALGNLYSRSGMAREAGVAWRNAAVDEANPDPSAALSKLGGCFMQLGRPVDAIEAYRTALDFSSDSGQGAIYGDLGLAYMASNRIAEAADAFGRAASDPAYQLTAEQQASYTAAQKAMFKVSGATPSDTDQMLNAAGYGNGQAGALATGTGSYDPLDPMGKSGEFIPSPEDTGFFSVTEEDLMQQDREERKARRKHNHRGLKVFLVILLLLAIIGGACAFAYTQGYGWPTQEAIVSDLFTTASNDGDISSFFDDSVSDETKTQAKAILPINSSAQINGVDRTMNTTDVLVTASLTNGGSQDYVVSLSRSGISWKVTNVELSFASTVSSNVDGDTSGSTDTLASSDDTSATAETEAEVTLGAAAEAGSDVSADDGASANVDTSAEADAGAENTDASSEATE